MDITNGTDVMKDFTPSEHREYLKELLIGKRDMTNLYNLLIIQSKLLIDYTDVYNNLLDGSYRSMEMVCIMDSVVSILPAEDSFRNVLVNCIKDGLNQKYINLCCDIYHSIGCKCNDVEQCLFNGIIYDFRTKNPDVIIGVKYLLYDIHRKVDSYKWNISHYAQYYNIAPIIDMLKDSELNREVDCCGKIPSLYKLSDIQSNRQSKDCIS